MVKNSGTKSRFISNSSSGTFNAFFFHCFNNSLFVLGSSSLLGLTGLWAKD
jgi:hypothetical protein